MIPTASISWNDRFNTPEYIFGTAPNAWLTTQAHRFQAGQRALCVADGEGRNSVWLAQQGLHVDAFDVAENAVNKARSLAQQAGVTVQYECCDCLTWQAPEAQYDVVAGIFIQFLAPPQRAVLFERMQAALKPGGLLLLQGYTPQQLVYKTGGPSELEHLYTADFLRSAFSGLNILELQEYEAELQEGSRHAGLSAVVGLVGQKPL